MPKEKKRPNTTVTLSLDVHKKLQEIKFKRQVEEGREVTMNEIITSFFSLLPINQ